METAIFISKILSIIYLTVGCGIFIRSEFYKKMISDITDRPSCLYFGGVAALAVGLTIINLHNTWDTNWTLIITLIGWIALIKGLLILLFPELMIGFSKGMIEKNLKLWSIFPMALGLLLAYFGYLN